MGGVFLFFTQTAHSEILWEKSLPQNEFNFCGLNSVLFTSFSSENWKVELGPILERAAKNKAELKFGNSESIDINAINSQVGLYVVLNRIKSGLFFLNIEARIKTVAQNQQQAFVSVWGKMNLIEVNADPEKELKKQIQISIDEFLNHYFKTSSCEKTKPIFYLIQ